MKGNTHVAIIADLPPRGIDLRAEVLILQRTRLRQALAAAKGDVDRAAKLLRVTPLDLLRLEERFAKGASKRGAEPDASSIPRIAGGLQLVSRAAICRYSAEGKDVKTIARLLGCNRYLVEKVVVEFRKSEIIRLDRDEDLSPKEIALRLRAPLAEVRSVLTKAQRTPLAK
jgi:hypothetical protein